MSPHLFARQSPQPLPTALAQPSTTLALSTTFTPPASCLLPSQVTILPSPGFLIWHNEPVPFPSSTHSACYPPQFLASYTSIPPTTSLALGSSIVPAMSPLVCPVGFCTGYVGEGNYLACCPSGYRFASTGTPVVQSRPAYGGVCYTDIPLGQELTALVYDTQGNTHQEVWKPTTTGAQGWAHPIDGWAASKPTVGCPVPAVTQSRGTASNVVSATASAAGSVVSAQPSMRPLSSAVSSAKKKVGGGVIAGAVLGALLGLAAILGLVLVLLRRKRQSRAGEETRSDSDDGTLYQTDAAQVHQKEGDDARAEVHAVAAPVEVGAVAARAELDSREKVTAYEMGAGERVAEMPAGNDGRIGQRHDS
ncbi:hypothetical protein SVAN01_05273 [Stagonosporopsis vannaccii]|nr:hypothetical protein SVAN01_05273 [Stagonosporopsis vannaccii]